MTTSKLEQDTIAIKPIGYEMIQRIPLKTKQELVGHYKNGYLIYRPNTKEVLVTSNIDVAYSWVRLDLII